MILYPTIGESFSNVAFSPRFVNFFCCSYFWYLLTAASCFEISRFGLHSTKRQSFVSLFAGFVTFTSVAMLGCYTTTLIEEKCPKRTLNNHSIHQISLLSYCPARTRNCLDISSQRADLFHLSCCWPPCPTLQFV